jgi:cathepsin L
MKTKLLVLLFVAGVALAVDTDLDETEKQFESEFKKRYGDKASEDAAAAELAKAEKQINEENELFKEGKESFFEKLNPDSDIPKDVFEKEKEGYIDATAKGRGYLQPDESEWYTHPELEKLYQTIDRQSVPDSYDSTSKGLVTSVKDQMSCGSCAAFATTAAHETCMLKAGARFNGLDLSEQYLIDCGYNPNNCMSGCNGACPSKYINFFATTLQGQSVHEVDYPYLDRSPKLSCPTGKSIYNSGAYVATPLPDYYCSEDKLKTLVATKGAVVVGIYASDRSFNNYAGGVYDGCTNQASNHAVTVVGYGTENGVDFWLVKNSWGPSWGLNGYIKIKRGVGMCNIGKDCFTADCAQTTGPLSEPPVVPPPPPIPAKLECDMNAKFGSITGSYIFTFGKITSEVTCESGQCRPTVAGPSNGCMYICGKLACA